MADKKLNKVYKAFKKINEQPAPLGPMFMNSETLDMFEAQFPGIKERATLVHLEDIGTVWRVDLGNKLRGGPGGAGSCDPDSGSSTTTGDQTPQE